MTRQEEPTVPSWTHWTEKLPAPKVGRPGMSTVAKVALASGLDDGSRGRGSTDATMSGSVSNMATRTVDQAPTEVFSTSRLRSCSGVLAA
jgi:hypothetical protein